MQDVGREFLFCGCCFPRVADDPLIRMAHPDGRLCLSLGSLPWQCRAAELLRNGSIPLWSLRRTRSRAGAFGEGRVLEESTGFHHFQQRRHRLLLFIGHERRRRTDGAANPALQQSSPEQLDVDGVPVPDPLIHFEIEGIHRQVLPLGIVSLVPHEPLLHVIPPVDSARNLSADIAPGTVGEPRRPDFSI